MNAIFPMIHGNFGPQKFPAIQYYRKDGGIKKLKVENIIWAPFKFLQSNLHSTT